MPELPEVEVLVRYLRPLLMRKRVRRVHVRRARVVRPTMPAELARELEGARFEGLERRGKYLLFNLRRGPSRVAVSVLGHLGMTGRMYLAPRSAPLPRHAAVVLDLGRQNLVFEDTRYFGRFTLDMSAVGRLGPEPLDAGFDADRFRVALRKCSQPIKVKLLDQALVAGVGNIYASEALFLARISPRRKARTLKAEETGRLIRAIRKVLSGSIRLGSTVPLNFSGAGKPDALFYFGSASPVRTVYERLRVYGREGKPCRVCGGAIRRLTQAARSTFFCPECQA